MQLQLFLILNMRLLSLGEKIRILQEYAGGKTRLYEENLFILIYSFNK